VGNPAERFEEDALRIMRALRFAAVLGFEIEGNTAKAMREKSQLLREISAERIFAELKKLLCGENAENILLEYRDVIAVIFPEFIPTFNCKQNCLHHSLDVYEHICKSVANVPNEEILRLAMFFHDIEKPAMKTTDSKGVDHFKKHPEASAKTAGEILMRLKSPSDTRERVYNLIREHDNRIPPDRISVKKMLSAYGYDFFADWLKVRRADDLAKSEYRRAEKLAELDLLEKICEEIKAENCCVKISQLAVNGNDLADIGLSGKVIGEGLKFALNGVIEEKIQNNKDEIINFVRRHFNEKT
jgi:tRNA nucleotidyltransferase (CCA-adding enzyme)